GAGGDQEVGRLVGQVVDGESVLVLEARGAVQRLDSVAGELGFHVGGDRVGEAAFVLHQVGPVDVHAVGVDALAGHEASAVDDLGAAAQDLLGVTAPQRAGAPVGEFVDDGDLPPLRGA